MQFFTKDDNETPLVFQVAISSIGIEISGIV